MKHHLSSLIIALLSAFTLTACVDDSEYADSPEGNFDALWRIIDEHYCYFTYKQQQYGLDWNEIYSK